MHAIIMVLIILFLQELVLEKESRVRELLLITGLKQWVLWTSWYIKQLTFLFISALLLTILLKVHTVKCIDTHRVHTNTSLQSLYEIAAQCMAGLSLCKAPVDLCAIILPFAVWKDFPTE